MWRVTQWLRAPDAEPPESDGLWGAVFDSIYHLQRRDREERNRLQTAVSYMRESFAALKEGTVMIDPEGLIEWSNESAVGLLGLHYPRDRGQALLNLLRLPRFIRYFSAGDFQEPLLIASPADAQLRLQIEITPFGHGSHLMFARDVTRLDQLEAMRRDFVANVSHELRTPLTVITGYLHTLIDSGLCLDHKVLRPLTQMREQSARMETLLSELLLLSELEATQPGEDLAPVDAGALMVEVQQHFEDAEPARRILIDSSCKRWVQGNHRLLYSALSNLLVNALKYSEGDILLSWSERGEWGRLSVKDSGPGIDAEHIPRLTERFYRVDKSRSVASGGTGLGLAIVKHILARHHGTLEITSQKGVGSIFTCILPLS